MTHAHIETTQTQTPPPADVRVSRLDDYISVVGASEVAELRAFAERLRHRSVQMVNSTAVGGGVAEMLNRIVPLMEELELAIRWDVITGGDDFFAITKAFHNALHGATYDLPDDSFATFLRYNQQNRTRLNFDSEFTVIHDPQPAALIEARPSGRSHWIWRCHIDLSHPNQRVWQFLAPLVSRYDAAIFSSPSFARQLPVPQYLFYPSIDPLADKNRELEPTFITEVLSRFQIDQHRPILTQISRFDRLKDPIGVLRAYQIVKRYFDCQLVLAGGGAADDPEGEQVLAEVREAIGKDNDVHILDLPPWSHLEINALQRGSTIVIQKSLREGFGLTVTEALWKKKPVVASAVGGIPTQVIHKHTGLLAHSIEGTAYQLRFLLSNPAIAQKLAEQGHDHVRENFLITGNVRRYLTLFLHFLRN
ncbi:MAG TPA: glycosyltransferase [Candidatus Dormibacteraeota bacterium]|nr:glycosyltransferase [Candidatus Dormibacteraeota bacterium]